MNRRMRLFLSLLFGLFLRDPGATLSQTDLTPSGNNPIIRLGEQGSWDAGIVMLPGLESHDGLLYLFYTGSPDLATQPTAIGFATSPNGIDFTKSDSNPIFEADGTGFDAYAVAEAVVLVEDSIWIMYYNARSSPGAGPGPAIGRATTVNDPTNPWSRGEDPVLEVGGPGEWDSGFVTPNSILATDSGYVLYYSGGTGYPLYPSMIGLATSPDGVTWTKYDNPTTTDAPYAESDPVIRLGEPGSWDSGYAWECAVIRTGGILEMYYTGDPDTWTGEHIGYASSLDGVEWTRYAGNPILGPDELWAPQDVVAGSAITIDSTYYLYYSGLTSFTSGQIGVATSPPTGIGEDPVSPRLPNAFTLSQNYPNPFNPQTAIRYTLDRETAVRLIVHDPRGRAIRTLVDSLRPAGSHSIVWDGRDSLGEKVASGIYFYRIRTGEGRSLVRKMMVVE